MKGLTLTLTIVIVAIVLLVTALVIMTIFGAQMGQVMGILNPWSSAMLETNLCHQACATWCQLHMGDTGPKAGWQAWADLTVKTQSGPEDCETIMKRAVGKDYNRCECLGIIK